MIEEAVTVNPLHEPEVVAGQATERSIGDLIRHRRGLTDRQVEEILIYQRERGVRFGEAAVALRLASEEDVLAALSQQFHYPYMAGSSGQALPPQLLLATRPFSEEAELFRELRTQLLMDVLGPDQPRSALAVVSAERGAGKSFIAVNLALALSQLGERTLLIDAHLRKPVLAGLLNVPQGPGLSELLAGRATDRVIHPVEGLGSLFLLPAGNVPPNPVELLQRPAFSLLLHEMLEKFQHVVVDAPSFDLGADARLVAAKCGAAIVVARRHHTRHQALERVLDSLQRSPARTAGVVMNEY